MGKYGCLLGLLWRRQDAVTSIEYALLGALIAVVVFVAVTGVGLNVQALFLNVAEQVSAIASRVL